MFWDYSLNDYGDFHAPDEKWDYDSVDANAVRIDKSRILLSGTRNGIEQYSASE